MSWTVRIASPADAGDMLDIYTPFIRETVVTFENDAPSVDDFARRVAEVLERLPWLACEDAGRVIGYAYAYPHRARPAYRWSAETSIYVAEGRRRSGVGRALYASLLEILRAQGLCNAYAGITLPNAESAGFHESFGFRRIGTFPLVGYKLGGWRDVGWWHLRLAEVSGEPPEPRSFPEIRSDEAVRRILEGARGARGGLGSGEA
jgi:phosphinothricin acetyltransferase